MAKKSSMTFVEDFAFYEQLWNYYISNRGKIRSRYNDLTKKFLAYNDRNENPDAFLRTPQFEALEMYVFIKEFMNNAHMFQMFDDWRNHRDKFSDVSYYTIHKRGQITLLDLGDEQNEAIFKQMKKYRESYPNYIYALTMGLGKTILMGTCIFYEFLLANKYPKDKRFCHNALVFAPDKTVLESLREIMTFDKTKVVPPEYARVLDANIKFHYLDESGTTLQTIDDSDFNIIISNNQKIIVKKKRKEDKPTDVLFGSGSLLADVYGDDDDSDVWDDATLMDNQRFKKLCRLPQLGVYVDEAHHLFGANLEKELRLGGANKTTLRNTINMLAEATSIVACYNYTGTPYVKRQVLPEVVYAYGLRDSISHGFLKDADPIGFDNVKNEEFLKKSITMFWERYGGKTYEGLPPKMAIFAASVAEATDVVKIYNQLAPDDKKAFIDRWKDLDEQSTDANESIQQLFYYNMFYYRALDKDTKTTTPGVRKYYATNKFERLYKPELLDTLFVILNLWKVVNKGEELEDEAWSKNTKIRQTLDILTSYPNEYWKYPVVIYYVCYRNEENFETRFARFLNKLLMELMTKYLMIPTINAVKPDILKLNSAIVASDIPTFEFKTADMTQLEPYIQNPNRNAVRMLLKTLAYEHQDDLLPAKWEIEHIFPQKWQTNYFPDEPDATIKEKIEHIGNKLPFEKKLNIVAGNGYFGKKKKEYTASKIVITKAMGTSDVMDWNLESITKRDIRVSDEVVKIMNRWNNEYLNTPVSEGKAGEPSEEELAQIEKFKKNGWI